MKWFIAFTVSLSTLVSSQLSDSTEVRKSPTKAVLYSFIPGGGQIYNGKYLKGVLILGAEAYMVRQFLENRQAYVNWTDEAYSLPRHRYREKRNKYAWWMGFIYVYNLVDALVDSHLSTFDNRDFQPVTDSVEISSDTVGNLRER